MVVGISWCKWMFYDRFRSSIGCHEHVLWFTTSHDPNRPELYQLKLNLRPNRRKK
jgi:hypothetical protein